MYIFCVEPFVNRVSYNNCKIKMAAHMSESKTTISSKLKRFTQATLTATPNPERDECRYKRETTYDLDETFDPRIYASTVLFRGVM